ncbi:MAG: hypothetical protein CMB80_05650 [Flammeovirgaceae bacterium]|nr:hypothetical protein [Flammeovirgaceae bacterium]|tara:strand:- start:45 stop:278 length:234 start_codon:yes stop_codon:yes gene_type:complete
MSDKAIIQWLIPILLRMVELIIQLSVVTVVGLILYAIFTMFIGPGIIAIGGTKLEFLISLIVIILTLQLMDDKSEKE